MKLKVLKGKGFEGLAVRLGVPADELRSLIDNADALYTEHRFKKKRRSGNGDRVVFEAHDPLRDRQRKIALWVEDSWAAPPCVHGFLTGKSIVTNAQQHLAQPNVAVADIANFFSSITADQVERALIRLGTPADLVGVLTRLTTHKGTLPPGARSSPIIANVVAEELDRQLLKAFPRYTRYADDLTFSGADAEIPTEETLEKAVAEFGWTLRRGSYRVRAHPLTQWVTGLVVNHPEGPKGGPHYPRRLKRLMRQEVYFIKKFGLEAHADRIGADPRATIHRVLGTLMNMHSVESRIADPLLDCLLPEYPLSSLRPTYDDDDS